MIRRSPVLAVAAGIAFFGALLSPAHGDDLKIKSLKLRRGYQIELGYLVISVDQRRGSVANPEWFNIKGKGRSASPR